MYKQKLLAFLFAALLTLPVAAQTNFRSISFDEAIRQAKAEKKLVFIDFYTDWCGPCKKMSREVFPQKKVGDFFNEKFVCIKLNAEKEGTEQAKRFKVTAYPTFIVLDTDENVKVDLKGAFPADIFLSKISNELNPEMSPERMKQRYENGERTPGLVNAYALSLMEQKDEKGGYKVVNDYFDSLTDKQRLAADNFFLFSHYTLNLKDSKANFLLEHLDEFETSVRPAAKERAQKLLHAALVTYLSGYMFESKQYNEADYLKLKEQILTLGLEKEYPYQPMFDLVECYAKGNNEAYLTMLKSKKGNLDKRDFELVLLNTGRLFPKDSTVMQEMVRYIRANLPELSPSSITIMGRLLMSLETTEK